MKPQKLSDAQLAWLAGELFRRRDARGLTQRQLAERAGISYQAVGLIEQRRSTPALATVVALASALGCKTADLVRGL